ncbi:MAG: discoidin domain-containing protein, partial [Chitinophagaceae bacterium]
FWGDGTPELNQCFYAFDKNSHKLCKELVLRPWDSTFYPGQQLEFLGEYGLWYYYLQTGDGESIKKVYPATKNFLFNTYKFGKKNQWFDWGKDNKDIAVIEQCFMYIDLKTLKKIALLSGNEKDTPAINKKLEMIRSDFNSKYWKGNFYKSDQVTEPDDRANAMAINAGLADETTWEIIFANVLTKKTYASCFFDRWVFEALCKIGKEEYALLRMYNRYKTMIPASFTTLWEHYDRWWASWIDAYDDASSLNHGWNPPVINLSQTIAGILPVEPGWKVFEVLPKEAFLTKIKVTVPSIKGPVQVRINKSSSQYSLSINSPSGTKAIIGIPKKSFTTLRSIRINGHLLSNDYRKPIVKGISFYRENDDYIMFYATPGKWNLVAAGELLIQSPKELPPPPENDVKLNKKLWTATASVRDSLFLFSGDKIPVEVTANNAIDGDHWTGWRDMTKKQYNGQWFGIDLKQPISFNKIVLDNTWALWDSPKNYSVQTSNDNITWSNPVAEGRGSLGITTIKFPEQKARYIKIVQTGDDSLYNWSIYELDVFQKITKPVLKNNH